MTTAKHTPGPWQIEGKYRGDDGSLYLSTMHPMPIFELVPIVGAEDEHIANARLISAAPDLLEALKSARTIIQEDRDDMFEAVTVAGIESTMDEIDRPGIERLDAVLSTIDAALSKAEGRE